MGISESEYAAITAETQLETAYKLIESAYHGIQSDEFRKTLMNVKGDLAYVISYHARELHPKILNGEV